MAGRCGAGNPVWDGLLSDFTGSYDPHALHFMYGSSSPSGASLGRKLSDSLADPLLYLGGIVTLSMFLLVMLVMLVWQCVRCRWRRQQRKELAKEWHPHTYRLMAIAIAVLLLLGFGLPGWAAAQNVVTTPLDSVLRNINANSQRLLDTIGDSFGAVQSGNAAAAVQMPIIEQDITAMFAAAPTACATACPLIQTSMETLVDELEQHLSAASDSTEALRDRLTAPWNPSELASTEKTLDEAWTWMTILTVVTAALLSGATGSLVLSAWRYHGLHRERVADTSDAAAQAVSTYYTVTQTLLTIMVWLGVFLGIVLASSATAAADITAGVCRNPYAVLDSYLVASMDDLATSSLTERLTRYYVRCARDEDVYRCEHPLQADIDAARADISLGVDAVTELQEKDLAAFAAMYPTAPATNHVPLASISAAALALGAMDRSFLAAVRGPADCRVIGPLLDHELSAVCDDPGVWLAVTALCYTITVLAVILLHVLGGVLRDGVDALNTDDAAPASNDSRSYRLLGDSSQDKPTQRRVRERLLPANHNRRHAQEQSSIELQPIRSGP